jgi:hypothetical protein
MSSAGVDDGVTEGLGAGEDDGVAEGEGVTDGVAFARTDGRADGSSVKRGTGDCVGACVGSGVKVGAGACGAPPRPKNFASAPPSSKPAKITRTMSGKIGSPPPPLGSSGSILRLR